MVPIIVPKNKSCGSDFLPDVVDRIMAPRDIYTLSPQTCEYFNLHGRRKFVDGIKLVIFRWGDCPGLSGPNEISRMLMRGRQQNQSQKKEMGQEDQSTFRLRNNNNNIYIYLYK